MSSPSTDQPCFITAVMKQGWSVDGDDMKLYLLLSNDHTGTSALKVAVTPVRVVCYNTLQHALQTAKHMWSVRHYTTFDRRIKEAQRTLCLAGTYMEAFTAEANHMLDLDVPLFQLDSIIERVLQKPTDSPTRREMSLYENRRAKLERCLRADDLSNFHTSSRWNVWGLVNAFSDFETHSRTRNRQNVLGKVLNGTMPITEQVRLIATSLAG